MLLQSPLWALLLLLVSPAVMLALLPGMQTPLLPAGMSPRLPVHSPHPPPPPTPAPPQVMGPHAQEFITLEEQKSVASLDAKLEAASVKY